MGLANNFMERLVNAVIQASKKIKTDTEISSEPLRCLLLGSIYMKNEDIGTKNILFSNRENWSYCENLVNTPKRTSL
jgi:glutamyl-tRNA reductase